MEELDRGREEDGAGREEDDEAEREDEEASNEDEEAAREDEEENICTSQELCESPRVSKNEVVLRTCQRHIREGSNNKEIVGVVLVQNDDSAVL